jgi:hypothetical protein
MWQCDRYQLADLLTIPVDSKDFETIAATVPSEGPETWEDTCMVQASYKAAGLRRFSLKDYESSLAKTGTKDEEKEEMQALTDRADKGPLALGANLPAKIEVAEAALLEVEVKVVKSALQAVTKLIGEIKPVFALLHVSSRQECQDKAGQAKTCIDNLNKLQEELEIMLAKAKSVDKNNVQAIVDLISEIGPLKKKAETNVDVGKLLKDKCKSLANSL